MPRRPRPPTCLTADYDSPHLTIRSLLLQDLLRGCLDQIEEMIREFTAEQASRSAAAASDSDLPGEYHTAETPTDVREVHF